EEQVVSIWAGTNGKLDSIEVGDVLRFEREMLDYVRRNTDVLDSLKASGKLEDDTLAAMEKAIDTFVLEFQQGDGKGLGTPGNEQVGAAHEDEIGQERIVKGRKA
ncbi:MAG TPA: F0F1 ATP synthase subunit alpha, partial [Corynebacterium xerosis]|nr:F0F1 ATP synthase subunit alpha [Corynebacterium xerosis]